jgi:uncharacterized SAM-binding protein YcdF (DUF218 family)
MWRRVTYFLVRQDESTARGSPPWASLGAGRRRRTGLSRFGADQRRFRLSFLAFDSFIIPLEADVRRASARVIFTGAFERVDAGSQLLDAGAIPRLYISGANAGAGIFPPRFVHQFPLRNPNIADLQRLVACCVEWGEDATNTFRNAQDTKCWVERREVAGPLLLITSRLHMARAIAALSAALPGRVLIAYPVEDALSSRHRLRLRAIEYFKYLGTLVAVRVPSIFSAKRLDGAHDLCDR